MFTSSRTPTPKNAKNTPKRLENLTWKSLQDLHKNDSKSTDSASTISLFDTEYLMRAKKDGMVALDKKLDGYIKDFCTLSIWNLAQSYIGMHNNQEEVMKASTFIKSAIKDFDISKTDSERQNIVSQAIKDMRSIYETLVNVKKLTSGKTLSALTDFFEAYHVPLTEKEYLKKMVF